MFKPTFLTTLIAVLLFWKPTLGDRDLFEAITLTQIFHEENVVSIYDLQQGGQIIDAKSLDDLMGNHSYLVYSSIKCKYADAIVEILQTFFETLEYGLNAPIDIQISNIKVITKKWLSSSINHLHSIKPPVVKMIHELFSYLDEYEELKTSDPSLLKSLLSINLFLCYSMNEGSFHYEATNEHESDQFILSDNEFEKFLQNVRKLNSSIVQMIGFVERFRNKRCVVRNPYKNNHLIQKQMSDSLTPLILNVNNLKILLNKPLKNLHFLVNNKSEDYSNFNSDIYDPEYLLFKQILQYNNSFLNNVKTQLFGSESDLLSKYNVVKKTYSIEKILEFQYSLINVIADIFYGQIYNIVTKPNLHMDDIGNLEDLQDLDDNFDCFIRLLLPKTCSISVCHNIVKNRYFLNDVQRYIYHSPVTETVTSLKNKFQPDKTKKVIYNIIKKEFINDENLESLQHNFVVNSRINVSFKRVFDLLSYEPQTNSDFDIFNKYEFTDVTRSQSFDTDFVKSLIELQCTLFTFRSILNTSNEFNTAKYNLNYSYFELKDYFTNTFTSAKNVKAVGKYERNFANMLSVIARMYDSYFSKPEIQNILLPLLIRFRHADKNASHDYDVQVMFQSTFAAIIQVENYLITNFLYPFYSLFVYSKLMVYDENKENISYFYNRINIYLHSDVKFTPFSNSVVRARSLYDGPTYTTFFQIHDKEMQYFWNGQGLIGHKILKIFQSGVIDFNDIISFQWFGIKFLVGKILLRITNALSLLIDKDKIQVRNEINFITLKLTEMLLVQKLPTSLHTFLKDLVDATTKLMNTQIDERFSDQCIELERMYEENIVALGLTLVFRHGTRFPGIDEIFTAMNSDLEKLKMFLEIPFLEAQNISYFTEFTISPTCIVYPNRSIRMLYDYK